MLSFVFVSTYIVTVNLVIYLWSVHVTRAWIVHSYTNTDKEVTDNL